MAEDRFPDPPGLHIVEDSGWREVCAVCGAPGSATAHQHRCIVCGGAAWFLWAREPFCPVHLPDLDRYLGPQA
jgi:hypothetical protein